MLKRKIYDILLQWKNKKEKKCLLVKGARQIGKTFIIREFGKTEYENYIESCKNKIWSRAGNRRGESCSF